MTLEELLNKLIEKGWKPFGYKGMKATVNIYGEIRFEREGHFFIETFRTLTSKESQLWQFVCENDMVDWHKYDSKTYEVRIENWIKRRMVGPEGEVSTKEIWRSRHSAEYRLIESALKDESELESFILDNIKIDE